MASQMNDIPISNPNCLASSTNTPLSSSTGRRWWVAITVSKASLNCGELLQGAPWFHQSSGVPEEKFCLNFKPCYNHQSFFDNKKGRENPLMDKNRQNCKIETASFDNPCCYWAVQTATTWSWCGREWGHLRSGIAPFTAWSICPCCRYQRP